MPEIVSEEIPPEWIARADAGRARREKMQSFGAFARGLLVATSDGPFVVDPEDSSVAALLLANGKFHHHELELASSLIGPEGDVLLIGAHIGGLAVPLSRRCRELVAFEANPNTFYYLENNIALGRCANVTAHNLAVSDRDETIPFLLNRDNSGGSKRVPVHSQFYYSYDQPEQIEIQAIRLDDLFADRPFDLIFMDIEGSEYFALCGAQNVLSHAQALCIEFVQHHIANVANVDIVAFAETIIPHFSWMYLPGSAAIVSKDDILSTMRTMFSEGRHHDNVYFLKHADPAWLGARGIMQSAA